MLISQGEIIESFDYLVQEDIEDYLLENFMDQAISRYGFEGFNDCVYFDERTQLYSKESKEGAAKFSHLKRVDLTLTTFRELVISSESFRKINWILSFLREEGGSNWGALLHAACELIWQETVFESLVEDKHFFALSLLDRITYSVGEYTANEHSILSPEEKLLDRRIKSDRKSLEERIDEHFGGTPEEWAKVCNFTRFFSSEEVLIHSPNQSEEGYHLHTGPLSTHFEVSSITPPSSDIWLVKVPKEFFESFMDARRRWLKPDFEVPEDSRLDIPKDLSPEQLETLVKIFKLGEGKMSLQTAFRSTLALD